MIIAVQAGYPVSDMNVTKTKVNVDNKTHGPHHNFSRQIHCILCLKMFNTCIGELNDEHKKNMFIRDFLKNICCSTAAKNEMFGFTHPDLRTH